MSKVVKTLYGDVGGIFEDDCDKWLGIPFAKPPVGDLRFRRAQKPDSWDGTLVCDHYSDIPYQFAELDGMPPSPNPASEDCLHLNVWAPKDSDSSSKHPVFVWIYGGAYSIGETSTPDYELSTFAHKGIVAVSTAYRLGPLGFYSFNRYSDRFDSNCAFSDVVAGLEWVHDNIEAFGGDPDNITICGESAGGTMVYCALSSPACRGLFAKAIAMSGLSGDPVSFKADEISLNMMLDALGVDESTVDKLVDMPYKQLRAGAEKVIKTADGLHPGIPLRGPIVGDDLLPESIWDALDHGSAKGVKCIIGTCHDEGRLFAVNGEVPNTWDKVRAMFEENGMLDKFDEIKSAYDGTDELEGCAEVSREKMFWVGAVKSALAQSKQADVYAYRFDFAPAMAVKIGFNATHSMDINPSLDTYNPMSFYTGTPRDIEEKIHGYLHGSFVNFCKTGDPNGAVGFEWEKYTDGNRFTVTINEECGVEVDPNRKLFDLWKDIQLY